MPFGSILSRSIIIFAFLSFIGALGLCARTRVFAQQRPGEVIQQIERDRREQELQKKEKQEKKPVVIEDESKKGPSTGQRETDGSAGTSGRKED